MESYGIFELMEGLAPMAPAMRAIEVRGYSYPADRKATENRSSKQELWAIKARKAAMVTFDLLRAIDASEFSGRHPRRRPLPPQVSSLPSAPRS